MGSLSEITRALKENRIRGKQANTYLERCIDDLLCLEADTDREIENVLWEYLPVFDRLISLLQNDDVNVSFYRSIVAIIRGNYQEYLAETECFYAAKSAENPDWLDWPIALQYFVSILRGLPILEKWDDQIEGKMFRAHQKYSLEYFPKSGFDLFCKFLMSNGSEQYRLKLLRDVLDKDPNWTFSNEYAGTITVSTEQSGIRLYEHQKRAVQNLDEWKRMNDSGGKVLWIAHRHELLNQAFHAFERVCYQDLSPHKQDYRYRIISGQYDKVIHIRSEDDILIASKSSLTHDLSHIQKNWIEDNKGHICMVIDEAHHAPASEYRKLIKAMRESGGNFRLLGLTATPFRTAEKEQGLLSKLFPDDILYKTDLRTLIEQGILSEPIFHPIETKIKMADWFHEENAGALLERIVNEKGFDFDSPGAPGEQAARLIVGHQPGEGVKLCRTVSLMP